MELVYTDGRNKDFIILCHMLDDYLNELLGGEKQQGQYAQYNTIEDIHDVILVYDGQTPVGCAGFKRYSNHIAEVKRVFVREAYRGRGISKQLMSAVEERAERQGYTSLILETEAPLVAAMALYKQIGYKVIENYGRHKNMKESVCMRKNI